MTAIATVLKRFRVWRATRKINRALNIELYDWQKDFIFYNEPIPTEIQNRRCQGKTLAHMIKLCIADSSYPSEYPSEFDSIIHLKSYLHNLDGDGYRLYFRHNYEHIQFNLFGEDNVSYRRRVVFCSELKHVYAELHKVKGLKLRTLFF